MSFPRSEQPAPNRSKPQRQSSGYVPGFAGGGGGGGRNSRPQAPAPNPTPQPVARTNSSGSYTGYSSGGGAPSSPPSAGPGQISGVGRGGGGNAPGGGGGGHKAAPQPKAPSLKDYLGSDNVYQQSLSDLMKTLEQFNTSNKTQRQDVKGAFRTAMERMGAEKDQALKALEEDFAARGLLNSGLYADSVSDYNGQYGQRVDDLTKDRATNLRTLREERRNFIDLNKSKRSDLRLDAIRRRAEKYGIQG